MYRDPVTTWPSNILAKTCPATRWVPHLPTLLTARSRPSSQVLATTPQSRELPRRVNQLTRSELRPAETSHSTRLRLSRHLPVSTTPTTRQLNSRQLAGALVPKFAQVWSRRARIKCQVQDSTQRTLSLTRVPRSACTPRPTTSIRTSRRTCQVPASTTYRTVRARKINAHQPTPLAVAVEWTLPTAK